MGLQTCVADCAKGREQTMIWGYLWLLYALAALIKRKFVSGIVFRAKFPNDLHNLGPRS